MLRTQASLSLMIRWNLLLFAPSFCLWPLVRIFLARLHWLRTAAPSSSIWGLTSSSQSLLESHPLVIQCQHPPLLLSVRLQLSHIPLWASICSWIKWQHLLQPYNHTVYELRESYFHKGEGGGELKWPLDIQHLSPDPSFSVFCQPSQTAYGGRVTFSSGWENIWVERNAWSPKTTGRARERWAKDRKSRDSQEQRRNDSQPHMG